MENICREGDRRRSYQAGRVSRQKIIAWVSTVMAEAERNRKVQVIQEARVTGLVLDLVWVSGRR
jgi:hypothetical protein